MMSVAEFWCVLAMPLAIARCGLLWMVWQGEAIQPRYAPLYRVLDLISAGAEAALHGGRHAAAVKSSAPLPGRSAIPYSGSPTASGTSSATSQRSRKTSGTMRNTGGLPSPRHPNTRHSPTTGQPEPTRAPLATAPRRKEDSLTNRQES